MLDCMKFVNVKTVSPLRNLMDPLRNGEWSLEEKEKFNDAIRDINLEGPECVKELIRRFPEKPTYQIRDQYMNFFVENLFTENIRYDAKLDSLCIEALETENFGLPVGESEEGATMPPPMCEDVGESSRKRKKIEAGGKIGDAFEEATRKASNKGQPWTIEEHELFLHGLQKYGRGKWRMISWEFVKTKTPIQVASHAQKYFERLKAPSNKRRASIHDIRLVDNSVVFNPDSATSKWSYGLFTNSKYATPECNYDQFENSINTNSDVNCWQFSSKNNAIPEGNYGHFSNCNNATQNWPLAGSRNTIPYSSNWHVVNNPAQAEGGIFVPNGPSRNILSEPTLSFGGQQPDFIPSIQYPWMYKI